MSKFDDVIALLPDADVKIGRSTGIRYSKYIDAITRKSEEELSIVEWVKEKIAESKDGHIRMLLSSLASQCNMPLRENITKGQGRGRDRDKKGAAALNWGFKYAFAHNGIWVQTGLTLKGKPALVLRLKRDTDILPRSLEFGEEVDIEGEGEAEDHDVKEDEQDIKEEGEEQDVMGDIEN